MPGEEGRLIRRGGEFVEEGGEEESEEEKGEAYSALRGGPAGIDEEDGADDEAQDSARGGGFGAAKEPVGGAGKQQDGECGAEDDGKENGGLEAGDAVEQGLVDVEVDEKEGHACAGDDAAEADSRACEQPDGGASFDRSVAGGQPVLQDGHGEAKGEHDGKCDPIGGAALGSMGMAEEVGEGAEHEPDEEVEHGDFMTGEDGGKEAASRENTDACGEKERKEGEKIPAEVGEGMGEGGGEGAVDVEKDEEGAAAEAGQKAGEANEKSPEKLEQELHGGGGQTAPPPGRSWMMVSRHMLVAR